ncbi:protein FAM47E [Monodelphis domestica]|uniref:Protein FAM47E n=1 Tax=Monodelphis domestica TaxID=13616 RepID=F6RZD4_MONDO|nr:protein FAM47E [Monodelphis domestica]
MSSRRLPEVQTLCPVPEGMKSKPWYRDRLPSRCFRSSTKGLKFTDSLNSQRWIFLKSGIDDFRRGNVPACSDLISHHPRESIFPLLYHKENLPVQKRPPKKSFSDLLSRLSSTQKTTRQNIEKIDYYLAQHPLALYPNLEESLPLELLKQVLKILDPHKCLEDEWAYCQDGIEIKRQPWIGMVKTPECLPLEIPKPQPVKSPYRSFRGEEKAEEVDMGYLPALEEHIQRAAKEFCEWVSSFGGNESIDVATVLKLFETSYEYPKGYNILHLMKMNQMPLDLRQGVGLTRLQEMQCAVEELDYEKKMKRTKNPYKPDWVKISYGAWYLNTNLWKKRRANEPLLDPKAEASSNYEKLKANLLERDATLMELHGTVAFKEFIERKGYRMPTFLSRLFAKKDDKCSPDVSRRPSPQDSQIQLQLKPKNKNKMKEGKLNRSNK